MTEIVSEVVRRPHESMQLSRLKCLAPQRSKVTEAKGIFWLSLAMKNEAVSFWKDLEESRAEGDDMKLEVTSMTCFCCAMYGLLFARVFRD